MTAISDAMSTHPPSQERVDQMNEMVLKSVPQKNAVVSTLEFERIQKKVRQFLRGKEGVS